MDLPERERSSGWWLKPLEDKAGRFVEVAPDEGDGLDTLPFDVSVRYRWDENTLWVRLELSPDEILEYWSSLLAEERAALIERHAAFALGGEIEGLPATEKDLPAAGDTLFERFAGVFHTFGCLRRNIEKALDDRRHEEAEMRLLGRKYDSLPELLRKTESAP